MPHDTRSTRELEPDNLAAAVYHEQDGDESRYAMPGNAKLLIRARKGGSRRWLYRVTYKGQRVPVVLGDPDTVDAKRALELVELVDAAAERGVDPRKAVEDASKPAAPLLPAGALTFGTALASYFAQLHQRQADGELRAGYVAGEKRTLSDEFLSPWRDRPLQGEGRIDWDDAKPIFAAVRARCSRKGKTGAGSVFKLQAALQRVWKHVRQVQSGDNRVVNIFDDRPAMGAVGKSERCFSADELRTLLPAMRKLGYPYGHALYIAVLTGRRHEEVSEARWLEFNADLTEWRLPGGRIKTALRTGQREHWLPMSAQATAILRECREFQKKRGDVNNSYVFSVRINAPISSLQEGKDKVAKAVKLAPWRIHDLRHTCKTLLQQLGVAEEHRDYATNHHRPGVGRDYEHDGVYRVAIVDAMNKLGAKLEELERGPVSAEPVNVLAAE